MPVIVATLFGLTTFTANSRSASRHLEFVWNILTTFAAVGVALLPDGVAVISTDA
jgi:hypothetical protein